LLKEERMQSDLSAMLPKPYGWQRHPTEQGIDKAVILLEALQGSHTVEKSVLQLPWFEESWVSETV